MLAGLTVATDPTDADGGNGSGPLWLVPPALPTELRAFNLGLLVCGFSWVYSIAGGGLDFSSLRMRRFSRAHERWPFLRDHWPMMMATVTARRTRTTANMMIVVYRLFSRVAMRCRMR
uniref:(northern house mosquito) hypothetical protein n=1 Tax=Culex pipiens TaxID=7175 RepID=A0A8D8KX75_CULPI